MPNWINSAILFFSRWRTFSFGISLGAANRKRDKHACYWNEFCNNDEWEASNDELYLLILRRQTPIFDRGGLSCLALFRTCEHAKPGVVFERVRGRANWISEQPTTAEHDGRESWNHTLVAQLEREELLKFYFKFFPLYVFSLKFPQLEPHQSCCQTWPIFMVKRAQFTYIILYWNVNVCLHKKQCPLLEILAIFLKKLKRRSHEN